MAVWDEGELVALEERVGRAKGWCVRVSSQRFAPMLMTQGERMSA